MDEGDVHFNQRFDRKTSNIMERRTEERRMEKTRMGKQGMESRKGEDERNLQGGGEEVEASRGYSTTSKSRRRQENDMHLLRSRQMLKDRGELQLHPRDGMVTRKEAPRKRVGRVDEKIGRTLGEDKRKKRNETTATRPMEQCRNPVEGKRKRRSEDTSPSKLNARRKLRMGIWARKRMARRSKDDENGLPLKGKSEEREKIETARKSRCMERLLCNYKSRISPRLESGVRKKYNKEKVDNF